MNKNRLNFSIDINADATRIWQALWNDTSYREWAGVFDEGTHLLADDWKKGSTILFLSADRSGIYSVIEAHTPNEMIQFKHIGMVQDGKKQPVDDETKKWSGATESYTVAKGSDKNILTIDIDVLDQHLDFMNERLPKALEKIKSISER